MRRARPHIRFLLGWEVVEVAPADPGRTLLQYLREDVRLRGTKEGCAEGDCGACTVLIGELVEGCLRYSPANACILFLAALDGRQVLTVEHVGDGGLHPAQQALVERHGSQCGFCTPGVVMSLVGLQLSGTRPGRRAIDDALAGNLCRCTGYGPIVAAARDACASPVEAAWRVRAAGAERQLAAWAAEARPLLAEGEGGIFAAPHTRAQLAALLARHPDAVMVAGATDVGLWATKRGRRLDRLIHVGNVAELCRIAESGSHLEIGAAITYAEAHEHLSRISPSLGELIRRIGSAQVRSRGTIGGNIANGSPIGDMPPALIALGASVVLGSARGRREIPLEAFFIDYGRQDLRPGEFVETIRVPREISGLFRCYKIAKRFDQDIAAVLAAFNIAIRGGIVRAARVCYGGMAGTPKRAEACEAALLGAPWSRDTVERAKAALAGDFTPLSDMRASAGYRSRVAGNLLERFFLETGRDATEAPPLLELADRSALEAAGHG